MSTVLIIEDEALAALTLSWIVEDMGHRIIGAVGTANEAESLATAETPDLILSDIRIIGERDGIQVVSDILGRQSARVVFITANTDAATRVRAEAVTTNKILPKPYSADEIKFAVADALARTTAA